MGEIRPHKQPVANSFRNLWTLALIADTGDLEAPRMIIIYSLFHMVMKYHGAISSALLLTLLANCASAKTIYRWTDRQGQVHFSDSAPANDVSASTTLQPDTSDTGGHGLRAAETQLLQQIQRRSQQQQQQAQARRRKASRERDAHRDRCNASKRKLLESRGHDNYKQYSRYLRNHCW